MKKILCCLLGTLGMFAHASDAPKHSTLTEGEIETIAEDFNFTEGPVWTGDKLIFSDIPGNTMYAYVPASKKMIQVFRKPSGKSNGLTLDLEGRLLACEHWNRRVSITKKDGTVETLVDSYDGKKLNSPNDIIVHSSGAIYFTDPPYGLEKREKEQPVNGVYRISPDGKIQRLPTEIENLNPNGLAFSPDEKKLYINASRWGRNALHTVHVFDVKDDGTLENEREFCQVDVPDGMVVDEDGRLYVASKLGVAVFAPSGEHIETIAFPMQPANVTFGDNDFKTLYVTAKKGLYKLGMKTKGIVPGNRPGEKLDLKNDPIKLKKQEENK
ncbi:MAG: SMP-30/gluconolactonase/LRE family protein [Candidatus Sumerlaeota bacterium]